MTSGIDLETSRKLEKQFRKLGFLNFKDIIKTSSRISGFATSKENAMSRSISEQFYLDDINARRTVDFGFSVQRSGNGHDWKILSISAFSVMDTVRNDQGLMLVQKIYRSLEGPLPHMAQMEKDILEMLRIEEIKEKFHIGKDRSQQSQQNLRKI